MSVWNKRGVAVGLGRGVPSSTCLGWWNNKWGIEFLASPLHYYYYYYYSFITHHLFAATNKPTRPSPFLFSPFFPIPLGQHVKGFHHLSGQSEPAPTSAPTWMDGALIGFSFLSLCHPRLTFLFALSQPWSALISGFFCNFIFSPSPSQFFFPPDLCWFFFGNFIFSQPPTRLFFFLLWKLFPSTHLLSHCPPPTYSPMYFN